MSALIVKKERAAPTVITSTMYPARLGNALASSMLLRINKHYRPIGSFCYTHTRAAYSTPLDILPCQLALVSNLLSPFIQRKWNWDKGDAQERQ